MEDLTKQQLVLVALLVSFVTSIATGIITVSLVQQAPAGVSQTINRIVQQTVQTVSPSSSGTPNPAQSASAANSQKVVTEDDLITAAVSKNSKSLVRISGSGTAVSGATGAPVYLGLGFIVTKEGIIVAPEGFYKQGGTYFALLSDGTTAGLDFLAYNDETNTAYFKIDKGAPSSEKFTPVTLGNSDSLAIGQGVVVLGGQTQNTISRGVITSLITDTSGLSLIQTDTTLAQMGAPLIDLTGNVIGMATANSQANFLPANIITAQITAAQQAEIAATSTTATSTAATSTNSH